MSNFITNQKDTNLKDRIRELIRFSKELKFLVGFFYFSGLREIYEELKQNEKVIIKILIGLDIDKINNQIIEYSDRKDYERGLSNYELFNKFLTSLKKATNSDDFDNKDFYEQVRFFIKLIKDERLIIRKTRYPNHAKLYIFELHSNQVGRDKLFITGSSNLTKSGLSTQHEFNVEISDYGFEKASNYFDELWDKALEISEKEEFRKELINLIEKETLIKEITPFEAFVLVLKLYLESYKKKEISNSIKQILQENGYFLYQYQLDAIKQALSIIEENNGVILADVVGLGKTIIACCIAKELKKRGVVVCPPGLIGDPRKKDAGWNMYIEQFGLYDWEVWSLGDLELLSKRIKEADDIEVVIIDEAHRFRNQDTQSYENLKNICRGKIVILLTATPFNNKPSDILSLLKLFITPKKSSITLESNLINKFTIFKSEFEKLGFIKKYWESTDIQKKSKVENYYQSLFAEKFDPQFSLEKVTQRVKHLSKQIRDVIKPVTIRRNRLDLEKNPYFKNEIKNLSKVADPIEWFFELTKEQSLIYDQIVGLYFADPDDGGNFKGAIYRPFHYETIKQIEDEQLTAKENFEYLQQKNLYDFMRRLLVKRFESSFGSFKQSVKNFYQITEIALKFIEKTNRFILDRSLLERIYDKDPEEIENYLLTYSAKIKAGQYPKNHKIYKINEFARKIDFINDIKSDLNLFNDILKKLDSFNFIKNDPKAFCLVDKLKNQLKKDPQRKIVIFSEYIDTVNYLKNILEKEFKNRLLTVAGDLTKTKTEEIYKNFDASYKYQENNYDILLTSDKLSEGFNLNRAGMIINYDIPWNPVRVIQRLGRINRISKKVFDELYIINFFPTEKGAELVKSREIAQNKMFLIHNTLGEDSKIFDPDEEPTPSGLYQRLQQNPEKLEEESFETKILNIFEKIRKDYPNLVESLKDFPTRIKVAKKFSENEVIVFIKKGQLFVNKAKYDNYKKKVIVDYSSLEDVWEKIISSPKDEKLELSETFWEVYEKVKNFQSLDKVSLPGKSLEEKAKNNLKALLYSKQENKELIGLKPFIKILLEDVVDYGTLPDFTLRRIANLDLTDNIKKSLEEINNIKNELGENYLEKEKNRIKSLSKEIILAIENRKI